MSFTEGNPINPRDQFQMLELRCGLIDQFPHLSGTYDRGLVERFRSIAEDIDSSIARDPSKVSKLLIESKTSFEDAFGYVPSRPVFVAGSLLHISDDLMEAAVEDLTNTGDPTTFTTVYDLVIGINSIPTDLLAAEMEIRGGRIEEVQYDHAVSVDDLMTSHGISTKDDSVSSIFSYQRNRSIQLARSLIQDPTGFGIVDKITAEAEADINPDHSRSLDPRPVNPTVVFEGTKFGATIYKAYYHHAERLPDSPK